MARKNQQHVDLHQPLTIIDVDGAIENRAMENYVTKLSHKSLSVFQAKEQQNL